MVDISFPIFVPLSLSVSVIQHTHYPRIKASFYQTIQQVKQVLFNFVCHTQRKQANGKIIKDI